MGAKSKAKPKLTDAERHKRFVAMAREVEASDDPKAFDRAFKKVGRSWPSPSAAKPARPETSILV
jgi:hypothetical protein